MPAMLLNKEMHGLSKTSQNIGFFGSNKFLTYLMNVEEQTLKE